MVANRQTHDMRTGNGKPVFRLRPGHLLGRAVTEIPGINQRVALGVNEAEASNDTASFALPVAGALNRATGA